MSLTPEATTEYAGKTHLTLCEKKDRQIATCNCHTVIEHS